VETLFLKENRPSTLLRRFSTPEKVASLSVYAASRQANATTGSALCVEGGIEGSIA
jgi:NAD(P)-dependent dehydrogenase (short-subunit alcohol dehydrogenase family)